MDYKNEYQQKLMSADEAVCIIPEHSLIVTNVAVGHPVALVNALVKRQDQTKATTHPDCRDELTFHAKKLHFL